jgi:hypothetical protein
MKNHLIDRNIMNTEGTRLVRIGWTIPQPAHVAHILFIVTNTLELL